MLSHIAPYLLIGLNAALIAGLSCIIARSWNGRTGAIVALWGAWTIGVVLIVLISALTRGAGVGFGELEEDIGRSRQVIIQGYWMTLLASGVGVFFEMRQRRKWGERRADLT